MRKKDRTDSVRGCACGGDLRGVRLLFMREVATSASRLFNGVVRQSAGSLGGSIQAGEKSPAGEAEAFRLCYRHCCIPDDL